MKLLKRILKDEAGQVLPMALVLLVLGGLLVVPALNLTATNLTANRIVKQNTLELYSADAGVADALWRLDNAGLQPPAQWQLPETVNTGTVNVTLSQVTTKLYKIVSIATLPGGSTTVEALVKLGGNPWFFDQAITSANNVEIKPNCVITGIVRYYNSIVNKGDVTPAPIKDTSLRDKWPAAATIDTYFYNKVSGVTQTSGTRTITLSGTQSNPTPIPAVNHNGNLTISGTGYGRLMGTVYVTGSGSLGNITMSSGNLDLNKQTIFAKGYIQQDNYIYGAGCLAALGDLTAKPGTGAANPNDYVFLLSVTGTLQIWPRGDYYGSIAGYNVKYWPGGTLMLTTPPSDGLDFPCDFTYRQCTYTIQ